MKYLAMAIISFALVAGTAWFLLRGRQQQVDQVLQTREMDNQTTQELEATEAP